MSRICVVTNNSSFPNNTYLDEIKVFQCLDVVTNKTKHISSTSTFMVNTSYEAHVIVWVTAVHIMFLFLSVLTACSVFVELLSHSELLPPEVRL